MIKKIILTLLIVISPFIAFAEINKDDDPIVLYSNFILQNPGIANKKLAIEKARETAANIKY